MSDENQQDEKRATATVRHGALTAEEVALLEAGGDVVEDPNDLLIEGPNSA